MTDFDLHLLREGRHYRSYDKLGAQLTTESGTQGVRFTVWAPHAREVAVIGDFNGWDPNAQRLERLGNEGLWSRFVPGVVSGARYKFSILPAGGDARIDKADPQGFYNEVPPQTASRVWDQQAYRWADASWIAGCAGRQRPEAPISIYEVHPGSWMRVPEQGNRQLTFGELAARLADHVSSMGFTHVLFTPLGESSDDASIGYLPSGPYAPAARYGTPDDLKSLVDVLHQRDIGVLIDWPVAHFARTVHGLHAFDGSPVYEAPPAPRPESGPDEAEPMQAEDENCRYNLHSRHVVNYLICNALFWLDVYHVDGLRVVGTDQILFPESSASAAGEPSSGPEDHDAVNFLRLLCDRVHAEHPGAIVGTTDTRFRWDVTRPLIEGGLGFDLRWDSDAVRSLVDNYLTLDPWRRSGSHEKLLEVTRASRGASRVLPSSRSELRIDRESILVRLPGDDWQRFANLRLLVGLLHLLPGKKDMFMGLELGSWYPWNPGASLDWHLAEQPRHAAFSRWIRDLNTQYRAIPALHAGDCREDGMTWIDSSDRTNSVLCFLRRWESDRILAAVNCQLEPRNNYRVGVPVSGRWEEVLNSDAKIYGGSGQGNMGGMESAPVPWHGHAQSLNLTLPPLGVVAFRHQPA